MTPEHMQMRIRYLEGAVNEIHKVVKATQAKVGVDGSEDPKSLDYRVGTLEKDV